MTRSGLLGGCTVAAMLGALGAGAAVAQAPAPTVTVNLAQRSVSLSGAAATMPAGPTRFYFRTLSRRGASPSVVALRSGVTVERLRATLRRAPSPRSVKRILTFEAGGWVERGRPYMTTVALRPATTYAVINAAGENPARFPLASFTVGQQSNGAARPTPAATVGVYDYAFGMPSTLPRQGLIRFENRGQRLHIGVAFRLRRGASRASAIRALLRNQERRFGRLTTRGSFEPLGIVSGGAVNDVEVNFRRPGNWVMACFLEDGEHGNPPHNTLGMVKGFRVR